MPILEPWNCLGIYVNFRGMGLSGFKRRYLWDLTNPAGYKLKFNGKTLKDDETLRQHKVQIPTRQNVGWKAVALTPPAWIWIFQKKYCAD